MSGIDPDDLKQERIKREKLFEVYQAYTEQQENIENPALRIGKLGSKNVSVGSSSETMIAGIETKCNFFSPIHNNPHHATPLPSQVTKSMKVFKSKVNNN